MASRTRVHARALLRARFWPTRARVLWTVEPIFWMPGGSNAGRPPAVLGLWFWVSGTHASTRNHRHPPAPCCKRLTSGVIAAPTGRTDRSMRPRQASCPRPTRHFCRVERRRGSARGPAFGAHRCAAWQADVSGTTSDVGFRLETCPRSLANRLEVGARSLMVSQWCPSNRLRIVTDAALQNNAEDKRPSVPRPHRKS
jgi:hypothetical protein